MYPTIVRTIVSCLCNMRKYFCFLFFLCILFTVSAHAIETEWAFDSLDKLNAWTADSQMLQYEIKNGKCEFATMGNLPFISYKANGFNFSEFSFFAFRATSDVEDCILKLVVETTVETFSYEMPLNGDSDWHDYIIEIDAVGAAEKLTVYFLCDSYAERSAHIMIDRIGFFATSSKAEYFLSRSLISVKESESTVSSGLKPPSWIFSESTVISKWNIVGEAFNEVGMLKIVPQNDKLEISTDIEVPFPAGEFKYFALRCRSSLTSDAAYVTFNSSENTKSYFVLHNDAEWHNYIIDMSKYAHRLWKDDIASVAFALEDVGANGELSFERMGFFANYNEASEFLLQSPAFSDFADKKIYKGDNYKITVPADAMTENYGLSDILVNNLSNDSGTSTTVVLCDGIPVTLSEVTQKGYIVYYAFQKGDYTVGEYSKAYIDTEEHWAKEYIDYVSARTLFSGTSPQEFSPELTVTRGMFVTVLGRMHGVKVENIGADCKYIDVDANEYYAPYIKWADENGIFSPVGDSFFPEQPITRGEMALVISNYIKFCDFKFNKFSPTSQFEDIDDCDVEVREAILNIQSLAIINGKTPSTFDPHGVSTRAEAATVVTRLIKSILGVYYYSPYDAAYFLKDKIHVGAYANFDIDVLNENLLGAYGACGFNMLLMSGETFSSDKRDFVLDYCDKNGIGVIVAQDLENITADMTECYARPSFYGSFLCDEPGFCDFERVAEETANYNLQAENNHAFVNLLPLYSSVKQLEYGGVADYPKYYDADPTAYREYLEKYAQSVDSDILMTNIFPFGNNGLYSEYIEAVSITASVANKYGKDFWCMIQSDDNITDKNRLSRQYYTLLSFGCTGFISWLWNEGICDAESRLTDTYYAAQAINAELNAVSDIFVSYEYTDTVIYNSSKAYDASIYDNVKSEHPKISELISSQPILVGVFENKIQMSGAYTLVNLSETETAEIRLDIPCETVTTYFDGVPATIAKDADGYFHVTLEMGQGVFVTE